MDPHLNTETFVRWFRDFAPYINAFRGRTFVIAFGGELIAEEQFATLVHDIALLNSLGVKLVLDDFSSSAPSGISTAIKYF